ncbi:MAG: YraN family protein [Gammaproteobacteria bacterium]
MGQGPGNTPRRLGNEAESIARVFLEANGLQTAVRNYRARAGEIDLIMQDGETIVFVEVRFRTRGDFVHPAETIDRRKQAHIINAGRHYLQQRRLLDKVNCRFDVVLITGPQNARKIEWIRNAFGA